MILVGLGIKLFFSIKQGFFEMHLANNSNYLLKKIRFSTDGGLTEESLKDLKLKNQVSLFDLDLKILEQEFLEWDDVYSVKLAKEFPDTLIIQVSERKPLAWLVATDTSSVVSKDLIWMVDNYATLIPANKVKWRKVFQNKIPVWHIPKPWEKTFVAWEVLKRTDLLKVAKQLEAMKGVLNQYEHSIQFIKSIDFASFSIVSNKKLNILFGVRELPEQLKKLELILSTTAREGKGLKSINLITKKNIPIVFN